MILTYRPEAGKQRSESSPVRFQQVVIGGSDRHYIVTSQGGKSRVLTLMRVFYFCFFFLFPFGRGKGRGSTTSHTEAVFLFFPCHLEPEEEEEQEEEVKRKQKKRNETKRIVTLSRASARCLLACLRVLQRRRVKASSHLHIRT